MKIETVADLKRRVKRGTRMTLVNFKYDGKPAPHKYLNVERVVNIVQTNSFALDNSWQDWPKRNELVPINDNAFAIDKGWVYCEYRINDENHETSAA